MLLLLYIYLFIFIYLCIYIYIYISVYIYLYINTHMIVFSMIASSSLGHLRLGTPDIVNEQQSRLHSSLLGPGRAAWLSQALWASGLGCKALGLRV